MVTRIRKGTRPHVYLREWRKFKRVKAKTAEIYELLQHVGVEVPGADPKSNLSAMLSNSDEFTSHGRNGWTLTPTGGRAD